MGSVNLTGPSEANQGDQLNYIGDIYLRLVTFDTKIKKRFLSKLVVW